MASRVLAAFAFLLAFAAPVIARAEDKDLVWEEWNTELFDRAHAEQRLVILDLEAVWCHWCHVMERTTYRDAKVVALLKSKYLAVRVDQDANPDLSNRYGDWGWPRPAWMESRWRNRAAVQALVTPDSLGYEGASPVV
jgi:hypothetical protein